MGRTGLRAGRRWWAPGIAALLVVSAPLASVELSRTGAAAAQQVPSDPDADGDGIPDSVECATTEPLAVLANPDFEDPALVSGAGPVEVGPPVPGWEVVGGEPLVYWTDGTLGVSAASGAQFVQLNAATPLTIRQDFTSVPGRSIRWSLQHASGHGNNDIEVRFGPAGGTPTVTVADSAGGQGWKAVTGVYVVPAGVVLSRVEVVAVSWSGGNNRSEMLVDDLRLEVCPDFDGDGLADVDDLDSDDDGVPDSVEGDVDTDGKGSPDRIDLDSDSDGIPDEVEGLADTDGDRVSDRVDLDSDDDGRPDEVEGQGDSDGDGIPDWRDPVDDAADSDGDGIPDAVEGDGDTDGDGIPDRLDTESDDDGVPDSVEGTVDSDGDGLADYLDPDSDDDGVLDEVEGVADSDGDGVSDRLDSNSDHDLLPDGMEGSTDPDGDGLANFRDPDSDGDGIPDGVESAADFDGDGTPNFLDLDSDGDGVPDAVEGVGFLNTDTDGDGIPDAVEGMGDPDGDGIPAYADGDGDNDGVPDRVEGTADGDGDGIPAYLDSDEGAPVGTTSTTTTTPIDRPGGILGGGATRADLNPPSTSPGPTVTPAADGSAVGTTSGTAGTAKAANGGTAGTGAAPVVAGARASEALAATGSDPRGALVVGVCALGAGWWLQRRGRRGGSDRHPAVRR